MELTCITCRVAFSTSDIQRDHYRSEWHRYNLKRKVAELPPIPIAEFEKRIQGKSTSQCHCGICGIVCADKKAFEIHLQSKNHKENLKKLQTEESSGTHAPYQPELFVEGDAHGIYCSVCKKRFSTHNAFENHMNSKKHKEAVKGIGDDKFSVGVASKPVVKTKESRAEVMETEDDEYEDVDTDSEIEEVDSDEWDDFEDENNPIYNNSCLFCKTHSASLYKNLKHMTTVHSFFLPDTKYLVDLRGLLMYLGAKVAQGYMCLWCNAAFDSLEAVRNHMTDKGHCMMQQENAAEEYEDYYDYSSSYVDKGADPDEEVDLEVLDGSGYFMKLPSGTVIGHRSLSLYFKQNVLPHRALVLPAGVKRKPPTSNMGDLALAEVKRKQAERKARDINLLHRIQSKHYARLGVKANKFQPHFRRQVMF